MTHPTQIFLSNPQALRVEYRLDDQTLRLWWSPKAGESTDCADRNYSSRDAHLTVFDEIKIPGCDLKAFERCDYDPYHCVLRFKEQVLHIAVAVDHPVALVWAEQPQAVAIKTARFDEALTETADRFSVLHVDPRLTFEMAAAVGTGEGALRHCHFHAPGSPYFVEANLSAGQALAFGVGLKGSEITEVAAGLAGDGSEKLLCDVDAALAPHEAAGQIRSSRFPELQTLRRPVLRGLHSMIDESAAYRASLKAIYYLLWVRDSGFSFAYQAAAGWPHKLPELCRLLLDNPVSVRDESLPKGRMFGQLINRDYGKLEEDGLFYVVWTLFTQWTQNGNLDFVTEADWALINEALDWVEQVTWDDDRGLFGEHFADETPSYGHRDHGWDYAIGMPASKNHYIKHDGKPVVRNYDVYFNMTMHSTYVMLAALRNDSGYQEKADRLWAELQKLLNERHDGIPVYAEVLLEDGTRKLSPAWGEASSCCIWGLTMPNFAPLKDWDNVLAATMDAIIAKPEMHWINGICGAMAAVDTWFYDEEKLLALHERLAEETNHAGKYLPMGGAMPEKFGAPEGNLYHDIRPQGFAMGAWLAAWASLGVKRLPYGLAVRPTQAFEELSDYEWKGRKLSFTFGVKGRGLALEVDDETIEGTLQLPESRLLRDAVKVRLVEADETRLWLRSSVELNDVSEIDEATREYTFTAHGLSEITVSGESVDNLRLIGDDSEILSYEVGQSDGATTLFFTHTGPGRLQILT